MKLKLCIIDNSVAFTGAFKCAKTEAQLLSDEMDFLFILPVGSSVLSHLDEVKVPYYTLPLLELKKAPKNIFLYLPTLFKNTFKLYSILKKEKVDILQINDFYNLLGVCVKLVGFQGKLITYVRFLPDRLPKVLCKLWIMLSQRFSDAVIAVSDSVLKQLPKHENTIRIYDAITLSESRDKSLASDGKITFLYLANYIKGKGQDYAIRAFLEVLKKNGQALLRFVGSDMGLEKNRLFKKELEEFAFINKISNAVLFEPFQSNIEAVIKEADIVLNFSEGESFSMTCAEASFYGRPVIASRCGGPEEIIMHHETGLLVENKNVREMSEAMIYLTDNAELRLKFGEAGKKFVRTRFSQHQFRQHFKTVMGRIGVTA